METPELQRRARYTLKGGLILTASSLVCGSVGLVISLGTRDVLLSDYFLIPLGLLLGIFSFYMFFSSYVDYIRLWRAEGIFSAYLIFFSIFLVLVAVWMLWLLAYI